MPDPASSGPSVSGGPLAPHQPFPTDPEILSGGREPDLIEGGDGPEILVGRGGADVLAGGGGRDVLVGGRGGDTFRFDAVDESPPWSPDVIRAGNGAAAFEGAGEAPGDMIDLSAIDADASADGDQAFVFGGSGTGRLTAFEFGSETLICASTDGDAAFEFVLRIVDGDVAAAAYTEADFIL